MNSSGVAWNQQREPEYFSSYKEQLGFGTLNFFRLKTALYNGKNKAIIDIGERLKEMKLKGSYFCFSYVEYVTQVER